MKFDHVIPRKIIKFIATRCQILRPKCTKFNVGPHWGSLQRSSDLGGFKEPTSKGGEGLGEGEGSGGKGMRGDEREGDAQGLIHTTCPKS